VTAHLCPSASAWRSGVKSEGARKYPDQPSTDSTSNRSPAPTMPIEAWSGLYAYFASLAGKRCTAAADYIFASERRRTVQQLTDQVAIVTGGAQGVGRGIASVLAAEGARVVIADLDGKQAESTVAALRGQGHQAFDVTTNVSDPASVETMAALVLSEHGRIDILAANAGIYPVASIEEIDDALWDRVMDVNVRGAVRVVQACTPAMRSRRYGRIVMTSSITGPVTGQTGFAHYGASKAAMLGFMRSAAVELATSRVTINAVLPGNVRTPGFANTSEEHKRRMLASIPMRRYAEPEDVGWAVRFLASFEAGYITGQTLIVDGGQVLPEGSDRS